MRRLALTVFILLIGAVCAVFFVVAGGTYDVTTSDRVSVPTQTFSDGGESFEISALGTVDPGEDIIATVTAPDDAQWQLQLRNSDNQIEDVERGEGDETVTFTRNLDPGSYGLALEDQTIRDVEVLVVNAYDVRLSLPADPETDEDLTITATLTDIEPVSYTEVELVVWDDDVERVEMSWDGSDYSADLRLEEGTYSVSVIVRGGQEVADSEEEIVAISSTEQLSVSERGTDDTDDTSDDDTPPPPPPADDQSDDPPTDNGDDADDTADDSVDDADDTVDDSVDDADDDADDGLITPSAADDDDADPPVDADDAEDDPLPLYTMPLIFFTVVGVALIVRLVHWLK